MTDARKVCPTIGCMLIEDLSSGGGLPSGLCAYLESRQIGVDVFRHSGKEKVHAKLQNAFYNVRRMYDTSGIIAVNGGIDAAVALSAQVPVERIVLICTEENMPHEDGRMKRQLNKLSRFARRNAAFCISEVMVISAGDGGGHERSQMLVNSLVNAAVIKGISMAGNDKKIWTDYEWMMNNQIYRFLCGEELTKSLAENPEMCIIYG